MNERSRLSTLSVRQVLFLSALMAMLALLVSTVAHAQSGTSSLGPVELIVEKLWNLEKRAIEQGQIAAGALFGGLATIHLMVVALQALNRGDGLGQFQEQLLWTGAFGSAIGLGPAWARAIVEFFRNIGRSVSQGQVTPQRFVDLVIELLDSAHSAGGWLFDFIAGAVYLCIAILAGLIALVVLYQETESHVILGAGAVVLGFGGAAATREIAIRYFRLALGSGLRLMLVEMINAAVMDTLLAGVQQAKTEKLEGLETAATLMLGMLIVLGFILILPIVVHSLSSGAISATAETLLAGLPAMAAAGGVARMMGGSLGGLIGGRSASGKSGSSQASKGSGDAFSLSAGGSQSPGKSSGRGGALPSKEALGAMRGSANGGGSLGGGSASSRTSGDNKASSGAQGAPSGAATHRSNSTGGSSASSSPSGAPSTAKQGAPSPRAGGGGTTTAGRGAAPASTPTAKGGGANAQGPEAGSSTSATLPPSYWHSEGSDGASTGPAASAESFDDDAGSSSPEAGFSPGGATQGSAGAGSSPSSAPVSASSAQPRARTEQATSTGGQQSSALGMSGWTSTPDHSASGRQSISGSPEGAAPPSAVNDSSAASREESSGPEPLPADGQHGASGTGRAPGGRDSRKPASDQAPAHRAPTSASLSTETLFQPKGGASE